MGIGPDRTGAKGIRTGPDQAPPKKIGPDRTAKHGDSDRAGPDQTKPDHPLAF